MQHREAALLWSHLNVLTKERYDALIRVYGSLDDAAKHLGEEMLRGLGCRQDTVINAMLRLEEFDAASYQRELEKRHLQFLEWTDERYPSRLREIGDPPPFLYARGDLSILGQPCLGLVGTRNMSGYGKRVAETFVPPVVAAGVVTVSGLAEGIDAAVAEETLRAGGRTVAVLGHGLHMIFPKSNERLADEITKGGGLLLTEFPLRAETGKYTFPARNRIIAGLSLGTVVLEAPEGSGAIITAELALEYGRDVFVVPGQIFDPNYAGSHALLAKGTAMLVTSPTEVLREIGVVAPAEGKTLSSFVPSTPEEKTVFAALTTMPQEIDALVGKTKMDAGRLNAVLTMMELSGGAKNIGGGLWVRT
ncbi:MAG: DNA-processing protein DprA [Candidatus Peribacteraceae bacterium]|nr:DNA-processing protein DprA [Candidatus Peribacteraceae bacterium]